MPRKKTDAASGDDHPADGDASHRLLIALIVREVGLMRRAA